MRGFAASLAVLAGAAGSLLVSNGVSLGQTAPPEGAASGTAESVAPADEGSEGVFPVSRVSLEYLDPQIVEPTLEDLLATRVRVRIDGGVIRGAESGAGEIREVAIADVGGAGLDRIDVSGLDAIGIALVRRLNDAGFLTVMPAVDGFDFTVDPPTDGRDLEAEGGATIHLVVITAQVAEVRAIRLSADEDAGRVRVNPEEGVYQRIRAGSPLVAGNVLIRDPLDDYVARLGRHPGRRVDVAVGSAGEVPGQVTLDYLVSEQDPHLLYFQVSNSGVEATGEWRQRFGYLNNQLTGNDDILQLDYSTAGFSDSHAVLASYEVRVTDALRARVYGSWNQFESAELGQDINTEFSGDGWTGGAELRGNVYQRGPLFVDVVGGARYDNTTVDQSVAFGGGIPEVSSGEGSFVIGYAGLRAERVSDFSSLFGHATLEQVLSSDVTASGSPLPDPDDALGRIDADDTWTVLKYEASGAFYIEPLLGVERADGTIDGPQTLAHEVALSLRGQWAFGNRLIPTAEQVLGGQETVRGYPESFAAGDTVIVATAEYRFHVPRALSMAEPGSPERDRQFFGEPFRMQPWEPYGRTDWDLILRAFVDAGRSVNNERQSFEEDRSLIGAGVGVELQFRYNLSVRCDLGFALKDADKPGDDVDVGDARLHVVATLAY
jgi:hypothetical protein